MLPGHANVLFVNVTINLANKCQLKETLSPLITTCSGQQLDGTLRNNASEVVQDHTNQNVAAVMTDHFTFTMPKPNNVVLTEVLPHKGNVNLPDNIFLPIFSQPK